MDTSNDENEHEIPWDYITFMHTATKAMGGTSMGGNNSKHDGPHFGFQRLAVMVEMLSWGDVGLYLVTPGGGLGGAAIDVLVFAPAAPALRAAPWIVVRGNHVEQSLNGATVVEFAALPGKAEGMIADFKALLKKYSVSEQTGMAVFRDFDPSCLMAYAKRCKQERILY